MARVDLLAEPVDHDVHDVGAGIEVVVPRVLGDERPGHHPPRVPHQVLEDGVLLGRQVDGLARASDLPRAGVQLEVADPEHRLADLLGPPAERLDPRQQLLEGERLGDVVVGARAEGMDLEVDRVLRREDQNRRRGPPVPQRAQHFEPAHAGQPEIEHQEVVPAARGEAQPLHPVVDQVGLEVVLLEAALDVLADGAVVLDDQDLHDGTGR